MRPACYLPQDVFRHEDGEEVRQWGARHCRQEKVSPRLDDSSTASDFLLIKICLCDSP